MARTPPIADSRPLLAGEALPVRNCHPTPDGVHSHTMSETKVHLNGQILAAEEARISVWDAGFLHGASAFTTMRAHRGVVFRLDRHLKRLLATAELLALRTDATWQALAGAIGQLLKANQLAEARCRVTLSAGSVHTESPTTLITAEPLPPYPPEWYQRGIALVIASFPQAGGDPTYGYKTGCYLTRVLAMREAAAKGAEEALWYTPDNRLAEASFCNVFLVLGGKLRTPPRDTPVLPGIVREAILELCGELAIDADDETPLLVRDMLAAEEIFLTSSCAGVRPVARVERHIVGDGKPGPMTMKLMAAYQELLDRECTP